MHARIVHSWMSVALDHLFVFVTLYIVCNRILQLKTVFFHWHTKFCPRKVLSNWSSIFFRSNFQLFHTTGLLFHTTFTPHANLNFLLHININISLTWKESKNRVFLWNCQEHCSIFDMLFPILVNTGNSKCRKILSTVLLILDPIDHKHAKMCLVFFENWPVAPDPGRNQDFTNAIKSGI